MTFETDVPREDLEHRLRVALVGKDVLDVQLADDGSARLVFVGSSLEVDAIGLIYPDAARLGLRIVEGGQ